MAASGSADEVPAASVKLLTLGNSGVGKSCLILRYTSNKFSTSYITTIGIDFKSTVIDIGGKRVGLDIWDTAGQERFQTITRSYLRDAKGIMLVYDVSDEKSFEQTRKWMSDVKAHGDDDVSTILVGNKVDLPSGRRLVSTEKGKALADEFGVEFFEVSARKDINVKEAFRSLAEKGLKSVMASAAKHEPGVALGGGKAGGGKKGCC